MLIEVCQDLAEMQVKYGPVGSVGQMDRGGAAKVVH